MKDSVVLKNDITIPAGTILKRIDGTVRQYASGNYECLVSLDRDTCGSLVIGFENDSRERGLIE